MKARTFPVLDQCIETGIRLGWNRAHKHTDTPTPENVQQAISAAIWNELYEWFEFDTPHEHIQD